MLRSLVGSEMCIRDSIAAILGGFPLGVDVGAAWAALHHAVRHVADPHLLHEHQGPLVGDAEEEVLTNIDGRLDLFGGSLVEATQGHTQTQRE